MIVSHKPLAPKVASNVEQFELYSKGDQYAIVVVYHDNLNPTTEP
jgi:hypothetical protein